jgi:hypothetical protein
MTDKSHPYDHAEVDSSFTGIFLATTIAYSFIISTQVTELKHLHWLVVIAFALVLYVIWDLVFQLYSFGQAVILLAVALVGLPAAMHWSFDFPYEWLGLYVFLGVLLSTGVLNMLYERVIKKWLPAGVEKRLLAIDNHIDKTMIGLHRRHLTLQEYTGLAAGVALVVGYYAITYLLLYGWPFH